MLTIFSFPLRMWNSTVQPNVILAKSHYCLYCSCHHGHFSSKRNGCEGGKQDVTKLPFLLSLPVWRVAGSVDKSAVNSFFPSADKSVMSSPCGDIRGLDEDRLRSGGGVGGQSNTAKSPSVPPSNLITTNVKKIKAQNCYLWWSVLENQKDDDVYVCVKLLTHEFQGTGIFSHWS